MPRAQSTSTNRTNRAQNARANRAAQAAVKAQQDQQEQRAPQATMIELLKRKVPQMREVQFALNNGRCYPAVGAQEFELYVGRIKPTTILHARAIGEIGGNEVTMDVFVLSDQGGNIVATLGVTPWRTYRIRLDRLSFIDSSETQMNNTYLMAWLTQG